MPDRAEEEIANGRLWRAKEILRGRLAASEYDAQLFARYAGVLAAMQDDDEAGRFHLLAGSVAGAGGTLARAFLARRSSWGFAQLWSDMPAAARRGSAASVPAGTRDLLREAGFAGTQMERHLADLGARHAAIGARRKGLRLDSAARIRGQRIGLVMAAILLVVLSVGLFGTIRLIWWGIAWATGRV
jgi:hypothetical protein